MVYKTRENNRGKRVRVVNDAHQDDERRTQMLSRRPRDHSKYSSWAWRRGRRDYIDPSLSRRTQNWEASWKLIFRPPSDSSTLDIGSSRSPQVTTVGIKGLIRTALCLQHAALNQQQVGIGSVIDFTLISNPYYPQQAHWNDKLSCIVAVTVTQMSKDSLEEHTD